MYYNGYHGDCSKTFLIGDVDAEGKWLLEATQTCLDEGIRVCQPGANFSDIGYAIEEKANELGYKVVPAFLGHGIGSYFHGPPEIYHISTVLAGECIVSRDLIGNFTRKRLSRSYGGGNDFHHRTDTHSRSGINRHFTG